MGKKMGRRGYACLLASSVPLYFVYRFLFFRRVFGAGNDGTLVWLFVQALSTVGLIAVWTWDDERYPGYAIAGLTAPYFVFTVSALGNSFGTLPDAILGVSLFAGCFCADLVLLGGAILPPEGGRDVPLSRREAFDIVSRRLSPAYSIFLGILGTGVVLSLAVIGAGGRTARQNACSVWEENAPLPVRALSRQETEKILSSVSRERWEESGEEEKLALLEELLAYEEFSLGLPWQQTLGSREMPEDTRGMYDSVHRKIWISEQLIRTGTLEENMCTLFHEVRHAYQHALVDLWAGLPESQKGLLLFDQVGVYSEDFSRYSDGNEDFDTYYYQTVEQDARSYADREVVRVLEEAAGVKFSGPVWTP